MKVIYIVLSIVLLASLDLFSQIKVSGPGIDAPPQIMCPSGNFTYYFSGSYCGRFYNFSVGTAGKIISENGTSVTVQWFPNQQPSDYVINTTVCNASTSGSYYTTAPIDFYQYRSAPAPSEFTEMQLNGEDTSDITAVCEGDVIVLRTIVPPGYAGYGYKINWYIYYGGTSKTAFGERLTYTVPDIAGGSSRLSIHARVGSANCESIPDGPSLPFIVDAYQIPRATIEPSPPACYNSTGSMMFRDLPNGKYRTVIKDSKGVAHSQKETTISSSNPYITASDLKANEPYDIQILEIKPNGEATTCPYNRTATLTAPTIPTVTLASENVSCRGAADGSITATASGGTGPYRFYIDSMSANGDWIAIPEKTYGYATSYKFTGLNKGRYRVRIVDVRSCTVPSGTEATITEPLPYNISISNAQHITCFGAATGGFTVNTSGGYKAAAYQYSSDDGTNWQDSNLFEDLKAGDYKIKVRAKADATCISQTITHKVIQPESATNIDIVVEPPLCAGGMGTLNIKATGGVKAVEGYLFEVFDSDGNKINDDNDWGEEKSYSLPTGTYSVTVRDGNGCIAKVNKTIIDPASISFTVQSSQVSCSGGIDGIIIVKDVVNGKSPYSYSLDGVSFQTGNTFSGLSSKSYNVTVKDANDCIGSGSTFVSTKPDLAGVIKQVSPISCYGSKDGALSLTPSGGTAPYTFLWSNSATTKDVSDLKTGEYSVTITDAAGCTKTESYFLNEPFKLIASPQVSDYKGATISCNGAADGTITLDVTGGTEPYSYEWSNGATAKDLINLNVGVYSVTVSDANGCATVVNDIKITEPDVVLLSLVEKTAVDCNGASTGSIKVKATGGTAPYLYSTNGGESWQSMDTFSNLSAGDFTIVVKDENGCSASINTNLSEPSKLTGSIKDVVNASCGGANGSAMVEALGGAGDYTYVWTDALGEVMGSDAKLANVNGGIYNATIKDANGCTTTLSANISSTDGPKTTVINKTGTSCFNSSDGKATISIIGSGPFKVEWNNGETGISPVSLLPGENIITITDAKGCVAIEVVEIPAPAPIKFSVASTIPSCHNGSDGAIEIFAEGGSGGYTYLWNTGDTQPKLENIEAGSYTIKITDAKGCELEEVVVLEAPAPISVNIEEMIPPTCLGNADGSITINAVGGNGGYTYKWASGEEGKVLQNKSAGDYQVTITDVKGCSTLETVTLLEPEPVSLDLGSDVTVCSGSKYEISSPILGSSYLWTSENGFSSASQTVIVSDPGIYTLRVTNEKGCEATDSFELVVSNDLLKADFLMSTEAFVGDTVVVIDISWPIPDAILWSFDNGAEVLKKSDILAEVVYKEAGVYNVSMEVGLADCRNYYSQEIVILENKEGVKEGRFLDDSDALIKNFSIYPNPNDGDFKIKVDLREKAPIKLVMVDIKGRIFFVKDLNNSMEYTVPVDMPDIEKGVYLLRLKAGTEIKVLRVIVK